MTGFRILSALYQTTNKGVFLIFVFLLFACSCSYPKSTILQPDKQPYQFQIVSTLAGNEIVLADLDGNGFTEMIIIDTSFTRGLLGSFIQLWTFERKVIGQANYAGRIIDTIFPVDYNDDGILELLVPFVRNDSLFVSFVNARGEKLFCFFLD